MQESITKKILPETVSGNNTACKLYHNQQQQQQQQYPTTAMLDHQPIESAPENHHGSITPIHNNFALQSSLASSSTSPASFNKIGHNNLKKSHDFNMTEEEKRQEVLERNRLAASKCRQRKKAWVEELVKRSDQAMHKNASLKRVLSQLKEDILFLKSQLLAHRGCQCQIINNYIKLHMIDSLQHFEPIQSTSSYQHLA